MTSDPSLLTRHAMFALGRIRRSGRGRMTLLGVAMLVGSLLAAAPASARPHDSGHFHDEFTDVYGDYCGVPGLDVSLTGTTDGSYLDNSHGRDGLDYFRETSTSEVFITDLATGTWVRFVNAGTSNDLHVTDNGDGTLTYTAFGTGNAMLYDEAGKLIAHDPGQLRVQFLMDAAGTPTDPSDDVFLDFLGVVLGDTGLNQDICEATLEAFGIQS